MIGKNLVPGGVSVGRFRIGNDRGGRRRFDVPVVADGPVRRMKGDALGIEQ